MKKKNKLVGTLLVASCGLGFVVPSAVNAAETSTATVKVNESTTPPTTPSGSVAFVDVTNNAKILFAETTLTGSSIEAKEATLGSAKIAINDTRKNWTGTGAYTVSVKYDPTTISNPNSFASKELVLKLASSNVSGKGVHTHTPVGAVDANQQPVFAGKWESGVSDKQVVLNPTLGIPAKATAGDYQAVLVWTLQADVN